MAITPATLEVIFMKPDGDEEKRTFTKRPLGMEFVQRMPLTVIRARCESRVLGVQTGWTIKAAGGELIETLDFDSALRVLERVTGPLSPHFPRLEGRTPITVHAMQERLGPVRPGDVPAYLQRFDYKVTGLDAWQPGAPRPTLILGQILGHKEKGVIYSHTWYALQCALAKPGSDLPEKQWVVERRLAHLRACLHDPVRMELRKHYNKTFKGAHFAHHGGPPGTSARLRAWLSVLGKAISQGKLSPNLTAAILRFLEAPFLCKGEEEKEKAKDLGAAAGAAAAPSAALGAEVLQELTPGAEIMEREETAELPDVEHELTDQGNEGEEEEEEGEEETEDVALMEGTYGSIDEYDDNDALEDGGAPEQPGTSGTPKLMLML